MKQLKEFWNKYAANIAALLALISLLYNTVNGFLAQPEVAPLALSGGATNFSLVQVGDGAVATPSYSFTNDTDTGLYRIGSDNVGLTAGGTKIMDVSPAGVSVTGVFTVGTLVSQTVNATSSYITSTNTISAGTNIAAGGFITTASQITATGAISTASSIAAGGTITTASQITATGAISTAGNLTTGGVLGIGTDTFTGTVHFGTATFVVSGTLIAHGYTTTPTAIILTGAGLTDTFTNTIGILSSNATSFTVAIPGGATVTTLYWMAAK